MTTLTSIEWATHVWNPTRGCRRVSAGCERCYAERQAIRHAGPGRAYEGLVELGKKGPRWTGNGFFLPHKLGEPLSLRAPGDGSRHRIFVNSMSDLFFDAFSNEEIAAVFGVMAASLAHDFLVLTKRPQRMREWFTWAVAEDRGCDGTPGLLTCCAWALTMEARHHPLGMGGPLHTKRCADPDGAWPLPNVWIGTSVEDQATADERVRILRECPAAVHWISQEPQLGPIEYHPNTFEWVPILPDEDEEARSLPPIRWLVVGGESGPGARPFDLAWPRRTLEQARGTFARVFIKQLGAEPRFFFDVRREPQPSPPERVREWSRVALRDRKGGDPTEWPADLRVREFPEERA